MKYTLVKPWGGVSPHMLVHDSDGVRRLLVKGRWFQFSRTRYLLCDNADKTLIEIIQEYSIAAAVYSIHENNIRIGSAGTNVLYSRGIIDITGIGHAEMPLGHGFKKSFALTGAEGVLANIALLGVREGGWTPKWSIEILKECNHVHLIAGLVVIFGEYLKRD